MMYIFTVLNFKIRIKKHKTISSKELKKNSCLSFKYQFESDFVSWLQEKIKSVEKLIGLFLGHKWQLGHISREVSMMSSDWYQG